MTRYHYSGDVSLRHGGYFYTAGPEERRYGYSSIVRITPCSDAGGPSNQFWVETLTVNMPDDKRLAMALNFCGYSEDWMKGLTEFQRFCRIVDACVAAGHYDPDDLFSMVLPQSQIVQIGHDEISLGSDTFNADTKLRANTSLRRWIKRIYLKG